MDHIYQFHQGVWCQQLAVTGLITYKHRPNPGSNDRRDSLVNVRDSRVGSVDQYKNYTAQCFCYRVRACSVRLCVVVGGSILTGQTY